MSWKSYPQTSDRHNSLSITWSRRCFSGENKSKMGLEERITTSFERIARGRSLVCTQSLSAGLRGEKWPRNRKFSICFTHESVRKKVRKSWCHRGGTVMKCTRDTVSRPRCCFLTNTCIDILKIYIIAVLFIPLQGPCIGALVRWTGGPVGPEGRCKVQPQSLQAHMVQPEAMVQQAMEGHAATQTNSAKHQAAQVPLCRAL